MVGHRREPAEGIGPVLVFDEIGLAGHRQGGERRAVGNRSGVGILEQRGEIRGVGLGMGDLIGQRGKHRVLARFGIANLKIVVVRAFRRHHNRPQRQ